MAMKPRATFWVGLAATAVVMGTLMVVGPLVTGKAVPPIFVSVAACIGVAIAMMADRRGGRGR